MRIPIYLLTTSHTHLLLTTPTSHTHRFHPLSKIVIHTSVQYGCAEVWMTILESGWNLWVWLVGVVSRRWVWLVVRSYIDILTIILIFPTPLILALFLAAVSLLLCSFFKCFFCSCLSCFFTIYSKRYSKNTRDYKKKSRLREYNYLIISTNKNVERASTARTHESRDFHLRCTE